MYSRLQLESFILNEGSNNQSSTSFLFFKASLELLQIRSDIWIWQTKRAPTPNKDHMDPTLILFLDSSRGLFGPGSHLLPTLTIAAEPCSLS